MWTLCWTTPDGADRWERLENADQVANQLLAIREELNATAIANGERGDFGVMDLEDNVMVFHPDAESSIVKMEDIPSYCTTEWIEAHSYRVTDRKEE